MNKIVHSLTHSINIANLKDYAKKRLFISNFQIAKYLEVNSPSTSSFLNNYLTDYFLLFSTPLPNTKPAPSELNNRYHQSLLKSACSSDADLLSYKGINLGSAINMKLAVKLGSLLGKQQG